MSSQKPSPILSAALIAVLFLSACSGAATETAPAPEIEAPQNEPAPDAGLANPASVYCENEGGRLVIRKDVGGGEYGVCVFPDGSECEEWAFYRGDCQPGGTQAGPPHQTAPSYINEEYGFSLDMPGEWTSEEFGDYTVFRRAADGDQFALFVGYQPADDELIPFRSGMGAGEIIDSEPIDFMGSQIPKKLLVFEGVTKTVIYGSNLEADGLRLSIFLDPVEVQGTDWGDLGIPSEIMAEADQIVSSFALYP